MTSAATDLWKLQLRRGRELSVHASVCMRAWRPRGISSSLKVSLKVKEKRDGDREDE